MVIREAVPISRSVQKVCVIQKEYPTAGNLGKPTKATTIVLFPVSIVLQAGR
jgi:hypothetical protein